MVIRTESSLEIRVAFTIILKHLEPDRVAIKVVHRDIEGWIVGVAICERSYIWYYYDSYWCRYASQWKQIYCFAIENQVCNINFLTKFRYQVVVWKGMSKKAPIFEDSENFIFTISKIKFSPRSRNKAGTTDVKRFLQEKYLHMDSKWMLPCYPASSYQWVKDFCLEWHCFHSYVVPRSIVMDSST